MELSPGSSEFTAALGLVNGRRGITLKQQGNTTVSYIFDVCLIGLIGLPLVRGLSQFFNHETFHFIPIYIGLLCH